MSKTDQDYMFRALALAARGLGRTSPNPAVGAVVVRGGKVVGEGWHKRAGGDHAEIAALKHAGSNARGARMFVTLEPCHHYGRTPPCVDTVIQMGIKEVIIPFKDPNPLTKGKSIAKLRRAGIKVRVGLMKEEAGLLNEAFIKFIRTKRPFVAAKTAQTLDGKTAACGGHSQWITSPKSRQFARKIRDHYDAILVGINTVLKDNPRLSGSIKSKKLKKIILDSRLRIPYGAKLFKDAAPSDIFLATTKNAPKTKVERLKKAGVNVLMCPEKQGKVQLAGLFKALAKEGIMSILIEGGAHAVGSALNEKLVDKMYVYIAPKVCGDERALGAVAGREVKNIGQCLNLKKVNCQKLGQDILITGYV